MEKDDADPDTMEKDDADPEAVLRHDYVGVLMMAAQNRPQLLRLMEFGMSLRYYVDLMQANCPSDSQVVPRVEVDRTWNDPASLLDYDPAGVAIRTKGNTSLQSQLVEFATNLEHYADLNEARLSLVPMGVASAAQATLEPPVPEQAEIAPTQDEGMEEEPPAQRRETGSAKRKSSTPSDEPDQKRSKQHEVNPLLEATPVHDSVPTLTQVATPGGTQNAQLAQTSGTQNAQVAQTPQRPGGTQDAQFVPTPAQAALTGNAGVTIPDPPGIPPPPSQRAAASLPLVGNVGQPLPHSVARPVALTKKKTMNRTRSKQSDLKHHEMKMTRDLEKVGFSHSSSMKEVTTTIGLSSLEKIRSLSEARLREIKKRLKGAGVVNKYGTQDFPKSLAHSKAFVAHIKNNEDCPIHRHYLGPMKRALKFQTAHNNKPKEFQLQILALQLGVAWDGPPIVRNLPKDLLKHWYGNPEKPQSEKEFEFDPDIDQDDEDSDLSVPSVWAPI